MYMCVCVNMYIYILYIYVPAAPYSVFFFNRAAPPCSSAVRSMRSDTRVHPPLGFYKILEG